MELRYYLCPVVTDTDPTGQQVLRPKLASYFDNNAQRYSWSAIDSLPILQLDDQLSTVLTQQQFNALSRRMQAKGIDTSSFSLNSTFLEALTACTAAIQPGRNRYNFEPKV